MSLFESILELTDAVEALIADGDWAQASAKEAERRELLVRYVDEHGRGARGLQELYDRSQRTMADVNRQRAVMSDDASQLVRKSKAVDAYLENAGVGAARSGT